MSWTTSNRSQRLPDDWPQRRAKAKTRAHGQCEATHHAPGCTGTGSECDHIEPGDNHNLDNLQWLSTACHAAKTRAENAERNHANATLRRRPQEPHPGAI